MKSGFAATVLVAVSLSRTMPSSSAPVCAAHVEALG
jgi:hypothetical protein